MEMKRVAILAAGLSGLLLGQACGDDDGEGTPDPANQQVQPTPTPKPPATDISYTFDSDAQGWSIGNYNNAPTLSVAWADGAIWVKPPTDGDTVQFSSPLHGNYDAYSGGTLTAVVKSMGKADVDLDQPLFSLYHSNGTLVSYYDRDQAALLIGEGYATLTAPLSNGKWFIGGTLVAGTEVRDALRNLAFLRVTAEYRDDFDTGYLDSFTLSPP